jgi:NCAIR mutase (PurE)-related protein
VTEEWVRELLGRVARGEATPAEAIEHLRHYPVEELGYAQVDHLRPLAQGFPEVVFCEGKTPEQVVGICESLQRAAGTFLATRADGPVREALATRFPRAVVNDRARIVHLELEPTPEPEGRGTVLVLTAGTSDLPVAEEAVAVARAMRNRVQLLADVGVAGIHRVLRRSEDLRAASVIIVVAGMDGALPSVVGGLVDVPVVAVPTSVGYGAAFGGISALLAMLNSCASGVVVVNIDNGFGAAAAATRMNRQ